MAIAILAVISGAKRWVGIQTHGKAKYVSLVRVWLKEFLELPECIPSHDTFARVFARINPEEFQKGFLSWVDSITQKLGVNVIAIDGKTLKQSYDRNKKLKALHIVSAWSTSHKLVLGQQKAVRSKEALFPQPRFRALPARKEV